MKSSIFLLIPFLIGIIIGNSHILPDSIKDIELSSYALAFLMFFVGMGIGRDTSIFSKFMSLDRRMLLLPLCTICGSLCGSYLASLFMIHTPINNAMAVASGMGYYSLSSIIITQYINPEWGTIALLSNIIRETAALLLAPAMYKLFGPLPIISVGGATTMDTTFPIIINIAGEKHSIVSIYHGFVTDLSVPFLVSFFCLI